MSRQILARRIPGVSLGILRWLLATLATLVVASMLVFGLSELMPGDPARTILGLQGGPLPTTVQIEAKRAELGLDRPLAVRYWEWVSGAVRGDFGRSWTRRAEVSELLLPRVVATFSLALWSLGVALILTITVGVGVVLRPNGWLDRLQRVLVVVLISTPTFVLGVVVVKWVVVGTGFGRVLASPQAGGLLPALVLAVAIAAGWMRPFRALLRDAAASQAVFVARSRGFSQLQALVRVALRRALIDFLPFVAISVGGALGATMLVEVVFAWPGAAALAVEAARGRDLPVVQAFTLLSILVFRMAHDGISALGWVLDPTARTAGSSVNKGRSGGSFR